MPEKELANNRKAYHNYEVLQTFEAGIVLLGSEIKSLRVNGCSLQDSFAIFEKDGSAWLLNLFIPPYKFSGAFMHEERRKRKLLLHKNESLRLKKQTQEKGISLIPLSVYLKNGLAKVKIGVCKGRKLHDKREKIKEKELKQKIQRQEKDI